MSSPREHNESVEQPKQRAHCANNCGFFSNEACSGLCSKCYQQQLERQRQEAAKQQKAAAAAAETESPQEGSKESISSRDKTAEQTVAVVVTKSHAVETPNVTPRLSSKGVTSTETPRKPAPTRCFQCNKRVGLTGFTCKCGDVFCGKHRHADSHECTFDHRQAERRLLALQNPVIKGEKLEKL